MNKLTATLVVLLGMTYECVDSISGGVVVERTVQPGDNITLHCDLEKDVGEVEWHRDCTHVNQPTLTMTARYIPVRFSITKNASTNSFDLRIENITKNDLGLYYCKSAEATSTILNVVFEDSPESTNVPPSECGQCWTLLISVCPTCALVSTFISSACVYCVLRKKGSKKKAFHQGSTGRKKSRKQNEDVCYASLDIPTKTHKPRPMKKRQQNTDFCTYSDIRTGTK